MPRLDQELKLIEQTWGDIEVAPGQEWFIIRQWPLLSGWNMEKTQVLIPVPTGYPATPPDNFYANNDLRLADGSLPGATSANQPMAGRQWLQFSFHIETGDWQPHADVLEGHNLQTYTALVGERLLEVS